MYNRRAEQLLLGICDGGAAFISSFANIYYYSGFTSEDAYLIISDSQRFIITDSRYFIQAKNEAQDFELIDIKLGWKEIFKKVAAEKIYFEEEKLSYGEWNKIKTAAEGKEFVPAQAVINKPRRVKDKHEIQLIKTAEEIGDSAFAHILEFIKPGMREHEVALELEMYMRKQGASGLSFETICASGVRSAMPHGAASDKIIEKGDLLTMDFGCVYKGYCSDMTRTVAISSVSQRQREIYDIVLEAQLKAIDGLRVGMLCREADKIARDVIAASGYGEEFSHSLGHSVGIEIHEMPVFSPKSEDILTEGTVMSVEPGIYIDGFGGVRIEDLICISEGKTVNLTASSKELIVL